MLQDVEYLLLNYWQSTGSETIDSIEFGRADTKWLSLCLQFVIRCTVWSVAVNFVSALPTQVWIIGRAIVDGM
jgi:hypothetical protein